jgi:hypothetical protein
MVIKRPDGSFDKIVDLAANLPRYCLCFKWQPPGVLRPGTSPMQLDFDNCEVVVRYAKGELEKFTPDGHGVRLGGIKMLDFARMLAKIAHAYAYAKCGPDAFEPALLGLILGTNHFAPYLVGGDPRGTPPAQPGVLHDVYPMTVTIGESGPSYLTVVIRLFAFWDTPSYLVVVGKQLKELDLPKRE